MMEELFTIMPSGKGFLNLILMSPSTITAFHITYIDDRSAEMATIDIHRNLLSSRHFRDAQKVNSKSVNCLRFIKIT